MENFTYEYIYREREREREREKEREREIEKGSEIFLQTFHKIIIHLQIVVEVALFYKLEPQ